MGQLSCDPRGMTGAGPTSSRPPGPRDDVPTAAVDPAIQRANRLSAANMIRSIVPLVLICVALVWWQSVQQSVDERVQTVDPSSTVQLAAARAGYPLLLPTGLGKDYLVTSARTDAGDAGEGDPVTVEIGYLTPSKEYAGFVVSDDPRAGALRAVLDGAEEQGTVDVAGEAWTRSTTERDETALTRDSGGVTVVVSGSATDDELEEVAAAVRPYSG